MEETAQGRVVLCEKLAPNPSLQNGDCKPCAALLHMLLYLHRGLQDDKQLWRLASDLL